MKLLSSYPHRTFHLCFLIAFGLAMWLACSGDLPQPKSRGAQLYQSYCSAKGCHAALPPKRGGKRYWDIQYSRMLEVMAQQGKQRPSAEETQEILAYLHRNARAGAGTDE